MLGWWYPDQLNLFKCVFCRLWENPKSPLLGCVAALRGPVSLGSRGSPHASNDISSLLLGSQEIYSTLWDPEPGWPRSFLRIPQPLCLAPASSCAHCHLRPDPRAAPSGTPSLETRFPYSTLSCKSGFLRVPDSGPSLLCVTHVWFCLCSLSWLQLVNLRTGKLGEYAWLVPTYMVLYRLWPRAQEEQLHINFFQVSLYFVKTGFIRVDTSWVKAYR